MRYRQSTQSGRTALLKARGIVHHLTELDQSKYLLRRRLKDYLAALNLAELVEAGVVSGLEADEFRHYAEYDDPPATVADGAKNGRPRKRRARAEPELTGHPLDEY